MVTRLRNKKICGSDVDLEATKRQLAVDLRMRLAGMFIDVAESPSADGSVELVAEVVTMTKQDYDDLLTYLVEFRNSSNGDQALLAGEVFRMLTGKSMWYDPLS